MTPLDAIFADVAAESKEWCFERAQPVTEHLWVAIFRKWVSDVITSTSDKHDKQFEIDMANSLLERVDYTSPS